MLTDYYFDADTAELMQHILERGHELSYRVHDVYEVAHMWAILGAEKR